MRQFTLGRRLIETSMLIAVASCGSSDMAGSGGPSLSGTSGTGGRRGDSMSVSSMDAGLESGGAGVEAGPPACNLLAPFGAPLPLMGASTRYQRSGGGISSDERTIYLSTMGVDGPGGCDLYRAMRT